MEKQCTKSSDRSDVWAMRGVDWGVKLDVPFPRFATRSTSRHMAVATRACPKKRPPTGACLQGHVLGRFILRAVQYFGATWGTNRPFSLSQRVREMGSRATNHALTKL
jgi:hypothetical protein